MSKTPSLVRNPQLPEGTPHVPVVIVGAGACGLTTAIRLRDAGIDCVLLERDAVPQGSTALSSGFIPAAGTRLQKSKGIADSQELFAAAVRPGDVIAAGPNFGIGSSREQAAGALVHLGVRAVIAPSFSGLYFRNAFNLGLLLLTCKDAEQLREGEQIALDLQQLQVVTEDGRRLACDPIPEFLIDMVQAGGLLNTLRRRLQQTRTAA